MGQTEDEDATPVRPGQVLDGKFRVERIVGEGAMGLVVEARHLDLDERVALKFLHREARQHADIVTRFAREARAAVKIASDHVARVYDVGGTEEGAPFIVMEFLEGMDLEAVLAKEGPLPIASAAELMIQACEGLTAAHAIGIVHRDVKPANLFRIERAGFQQVKLVDFGISKASITGTFEDIDLSSAQTTQIMGSPHYMSPEQIRSTRDVDGRADIWSLGVAMYELLTGTTPFTALEVTGIIAQVLHERHPSARQLRPDIPPELEAVVDRCLEKDAERRFQSAAHLAVALLPFAPKRARAVVDRATALYSRAHGQTQVLESLPPPMPVPPRPVVTNEGSRSTTGVALTATPPPEPTRRPLFLWVALAGALLLVGAVVFRLREPPRNEPAASSATPPSAVSPVTAAATPMPPTAEATAKPTASASAPAVSAAPSASPVRPGAPPVSAHPARPAKPNAPGSPDSDIRLER